MPPIKQLTTDELETWTTASLVLNIARYAANPAWERDQVHKANAQNCAAELNARVPARQVRGG